MKTQLNQVEHYYCDFGPITAENGKRNDLMVAELLNEIIEKYSMNIGQMLVVRCWCDRYFETSYNYYRNCFIFHTLAYVLPMTYFFAIDDRQTTSLKVSVLGFTF